MSGTSSVVLLIERNEASGTAYGDALRASGFTVVLVPDTAAALYALTEITPEIVIAGFNAQTHDECLAFCERLKDDSRTRAIPVLLTSETIDGEDLERAIEMKVLGLAVGPNDGAKMTAAVQGVLAVAEGRTSMSQPASTVNRSS